MNERLAGGLCIYIDTLFTVGDLFVLASSSSVFGFWLCFLLILAEILIMNGICMFRYVDA